MIYFFPLHPVFTINKVEIRADPSLQVPNGDALTILCIADISKSGNFTIEHHFTFFKDGRILSGITSLQNRTEYKIPAARFADTGEYVCMVKAKEKKKKSEVMLVKVTGKYFFNHSFLLLQLAEHGHWLELL